MKKKYYLSMLSIFPIIMIFNCIYFVYHKSLSIFLGFGLLHFILFAVLNLLGAYYIFKPIDELLINKDYTEKSFHRIQYLGFYSSGWIFIIGFIYLLISIIPLLILPDLFKNPEDFKIEKIPEEFLFQSIIPSLSFIYVIFPSFITYYIINDYNLSLKSEIFKLCNIQFTAKKNRIGFSLIFVFLCLVILPSLLVIIELKVALGIREKFSQFTTLSPLETLLIDRFIVFIGMIIAIYLITRAFTRPIDLLLNAISKVSEGDYTTQAPITTNDEIGILTIEFNNLVLGLKDREVIRDTFGKYVTKDIANIILEKKINLEGEVKQCTILVTDIADYTSLSEELEPKEIISMLNEYFSELVKIIQNHKGVVNKFIGDSIFAIFNVPIDDVLHATNAIQAAIEIQNITNRKTFGKNKILKTRIGINTGEVVAGNIGSNDRSEYTVIGDEVNVASRLEQMNKEFGSQILLGENTYFLAKENFIFKALGEAKLKGKERLIKVYTIDL